MGRLRLTTLGDLLGAILREQLTGTLELTEECGPRAGRMHRLFLQAGHVVQVDTQEAVQPLGEMLVEAGWFERDSLLGYVRSAAEAGIPLGQWLVDNNKVSSRAMVEAIVQQVRWRLDALFRVEDARIAFRVISARRHDLDSPRPLDARDYLVGRPRARDRKGTAPAKAMPSREISLERRRDLLVLGLSPGAAEDEIRSRFRRLARAFHPDRHPEATTRQSEVLRRRFSAISAAYHRLLGACSDSKMAI